MDWEGPRTPPTFWTPSIPPLERRLSADSPLLTPYRALRLAWVVSTLPLHLFLVGLSLVPFFHHRLPDFLSPGKKQRWNPQQRVVYPLLRRVIWAVSDVGNVGDLTPSSPDRPVWWGTLLEKVTVVVGGGAKVHLDIRKVRLPDEAEGKGWVEGEVRDPRGRIGFEEVPLFWFEREGEERTAVGRGGDRWKARSEKDRVVVYFVGGGYVTGNPTEGSRAFKLARETGLRVVGANFRKADTASQAFPAALQDALATYAHLVLHLGYRDIVLAGDSAGATLALSLLQYLALVVPHAEGMVLPSGLLLYSPWVDATASHYAKATVDEYQDDIICPGMATNALRGYLLHVNSPPPTSALKAFSGYAGDDSVYTLRNRHPWFSPALPASLPALTAVARAYLSSPHPSTDEDGESSLRQRRTTATHRPLRFFITTGRAELFHAEVHSLILNLRAASRATALSSTISLGSAEPFEVEAMEAEGEVHAFPLVPEWRAWRCLSVCLSSASFVLTSSSPPTAPAATSSTVQRPPPDLAQQPNERTSLLGGSTTNNHSSSHHRSDSHSFHIPNAHFRPPPLFSPTDERHPPHRSRTPSPLPRPEPNLPPSDTNPSYVPNYHSSPHPISRTPSPSPPPSSYGDSQDDREPHRVPGFAESIKNFLFSSWVNLLLVAVPLSFASHFAGWGATADFVISFIAIIPLASLLGDATEQASIKLGQTVGGLLNATFGNAVELIVGILALIRGELRIVQTSLLGSILSNLLLVLGCSFVAGGAVFKEQTFQQTAAQASSSLMVLAVATLVIPAAYHASQLDGSAGGDGLLGVLDAAKKGADEAGLLKLSRGTAIVLLLCYASYLYFQLRSHAYLFEDPSSHEEEEARMNITTATGALVVVTVVTSFCADYLVGAIDEFAQKYSIPKAFIGLILLPIVGNAAEHVTSVWMAAKGKMELTIGVAVGSSIQIAVGLIPILVLVGWVIDQDLTLFFQNFETIVLFVSVLLVDILVSDGRSNYLEGLMLIALYLVIALAFWVS
ncbi:hypothetical protein JCM8097_005880 [Rhodosporidiobolus ruineniae]